MSGFSGNTQSAALDNLAFSLMSRMHVILRRQNERVTDIEYMRVNPEYCRVILNLASALPNDDLQKISQKLEEIYFGEGGLFVSPPPPEPLLSKLASLSNRGNAVDVMGKKAELLSSSDIDLATLPHLDQDSLIDQMYVGRLR